MFWNVLLRNWMLEDPSGPAPMPSPLLVVVGLEMFETVLLENVTLKHGLVPSARRPTCVFVPVGDTFRVTFSTVFPWTNAPTASQVDMPTSLAPSMMLFRT